MSSRPDDAADGEADDASCDALGSRLLESLTAAIAAGDDTALPESFQSAVRENRGRELNGAVLCRLVDAALKDFWPGAADDALRTAVSQSVTQRLFDEPALVAKVEKLLNSSAPGST